MTSSRSPGKRIVRKQQNSVERLFKTPIGGGEKLFALRSSLREVEMNKHKAVPDISENSKALISRFGGIKGAYYGLNYEDIKKQKEGRLSHLKE